MDHPADTDKFVEIFSSKRVLFYSHQDAHARELKTQQTIYWKKLKNSLVGVLHDTSSDPKFTNQFASLLDFIVRNAEKRVNIGRRSDGGFVVESDLPLLDSNHNISDITATDANFLAAAVLAEVLPPILSGNFDDSELSLNDISGGGISILVSKYLARKEFLSVDGKGQLADREADFTAFISKLEETAQNIIDDVREKKDLHQILLDEFDKNTNAVLTNFDEMADRKVDAHLAAQSEFRKVKRPVDLWSNNAKRHRRSFWLGLGALLVVIVAAAITAFKALPNMIETLGISNADASGHFTPATTLVLATIIALLAAAGFVVKIMGRFVTNALTLAEDAEVRAALADTFIGLTAEDTTLDEKARDQARTVMLAALFRPLPGHQQEEITAPTVLSLAQDMLGKKPDKD